MDINKIEKGVPIALVYHSDRSGETKERVVIPTYIPYQNLRSIDVTELTEEQQQELAGLVREYLEYYDRFVSQAFNFETWAEQQGIHLQPKWRALKLTNIKQVKSEG